MIHRKVNKRAFAMAAPLALRLDFNASELRGYARQTRDARISSTSRKLRLKQW